MASRTSSPSLPRAEDLPSRLPDHAVAQRVHVVPAMVMTLMLKNLMSGAGLPSDLLHHLQRMRALHLVAEDPARALVDERALVTFGVRLVPAASRGGIAPSCATDGRPTRLNLVSVEVEQDRVADHVAVVVAGDELLGLDRP